MKENKAKYFDNKEELIDNLKSFDNTELKNIAYYMGKIACEKYTWKNISDLYASIF